MYIESVRKIILDSIDIPLACVHSYGCQQNVSDGEKLAGMLSMMGYGITDDMTKASLILLNTCAVRENAETRLYGNLGEISHLKEQNPDLIIAVCGCMAEEAHNVEKLKNTYRYVDIVFGTFSFSKFPRLLYTVLTEKKRAFDIEKYSSEKESFPENVKPVRKSSFKGSVSIMYGCNNFCTYCIVPYVRGRERSRDPENILNEVRELAEGGCKEIMLLGQNVNSYKSSCNFAELLYKVNEIDGDFRIRFMSPHPKDATREFIDAVLECDKVCKSIHLPIQSGSDRVLKLMHRGYNMEKYIDIVNYLRNKAPDFSLTTDIIVGFPGETREDFEETLKAIKSVKYDNIYSFIFSRRKGTKAYDMEDVVSEEEKGKWFREMLSVQREISDEHMKRFMGKDMKVLFDSFSRKEGFISGKSDEFIITEAKGDKSLIGQYKTVHVNQTHNWAVCGDIV